MSLYFLHQDDYTLQTSCTSCINIYGSLCVIATLPSSAYLNILACSSTKSDIELVLLNMSVMNIINNNWLRTDPWGTPNFPHFLGNDLYLFIIICTFLVKRKEFIRLRILPLMFRLYSFKHYQKLSQNQYRGVRLPFVSFVPSLSWPLTCRGILWYFLWPWSPLVHHLELSLNHKNFWSFIPIPVLIVYPYKLK